MSKPKSSYVVQNDPSARCPACENGSVRLLCHRNGDFRYHPAFYICTCGYIGQVGVGPVTAEQVL